MSVSVNKSAAVICSDSATATIVARMLRRQGFEVDVIDNQPAFSVLKHGLVVLDVRSPEGLEYCRQVSEQCHLPVLALVGENSRNRAEALAAGADDCVGKPLEDNELVIKSEALWHAYWSREGAQTVGPTKEEGDLIVDAAHHEVRLGGARIDLTSTEMALLRVLADNRGHAVSRTKLFGAVWGSESGSSTRVVDLAVFRLRAKLGRKDGHVRLRSVPRFGYRLE